MPKKTIARSILELLGKNLNARGVSKVLGVPRDTVAGVQALSLQPGRPWDDIPGWDGGRPGPAMGYAEPAYLFAATMPYSQVSYVGVAAGMDGRAWLSCHVDMSRFFGGAPVKVVCDNLKTGVAPHPKRGGAILNGAYLSPGGYYPVAAMPAGVEKPKQEASVEGGAGKIATAVTAKPRNDTFPSLAALNAGIRKAAKESNGKPSQKCPGSRRGTFETEGKPYLGALPPIPYEACGWPYGHKAGSTPIYGGTKASIPFHSGISDARWKPNLTAILYLSIITEQGQQGTRYPPKYMANGMRTGQAHLPLPPKKSLPVEGPRDKARGISAGGVGRKDCQAGIGEGQAGKGMGQ